MTATLSSFGQAPAAQNGVGNNAATGAVELGGDLVRPTVINTSAVNTLAVTGLAAGDPATDTLIVIAPDGTVKFLNATGLPDFWRSGAGDVFPDGTTDYADNISHEGNVGVGITDTSQVRSKLDVAGAVIHRPITLINFAANAAIGTAVATVDVASVILIPQTTAGITLTLPNPTQAQAGRLLIVGNTGNQPVTVAGQAVNNASAMPFVWTGAAWVPLGSAASNDWKITGNTGTAPTAYADNAAQTGNFVGTLDNQAFAIYANASNINAKSDLRLYPSIPSNGITAASDIFHIRRNGQAGQAGLTFPQVLSVALGKWLADINSRTRADFRLGNGGVTVPDFTALSLFSQGGVGITGNGSAADWAWAATGGIGRGNGGALLALMGGNRSNNLGPHIGAWTSADTYPVYYQLNWMHNNIGMIFDGYFDGGWKHSHTTRAYAIYKANDALNFYGSANPGVAGNAWTQDLMGRWRYAGATLAGGELDFASIVKNRRIVLFDANAASDHQFYGFGVNNSVLRYQIDSVTSSHIWYAATSATASNELMRLTGAGNLGLGGATGIARLDVNGAAVLRSVVLADIPLPGPIGTAGATVDVASTVVLNQTTNNVALTLPNPANATAGRLLYVTHNGTATGITVAGKSINTGETISFVWDGNSWNPPAYIAPNRAYVYAAAAANTVVANNAATVANWPETTDSGNNSAAGIFTAPRAGFYSVAAAVTYLVAAWNATTYAQISIAVNGADRHQGTATVEKAGNRIVSVNVSATVFLTAGQTLQINVFQNSGTAKNTAGGVVSYYTIVEL